MLDGPIKYPLHGKVAAVRSPDGQMLTLVSLHTPHSVAPHTLTPRHSTKRTPRCLSRTLLGSQRIDSDGERAHADKKNGKEIDFAVGEESVLSFTLPCPCCWHPSGGEGRSQLYTYIVKARGIQNNIRELRLLSAHFHKFKVDVVFCHARYVGIAWRKHIYKTLGPADPATEPLDPDAVRFLKETGHIDWHQLLP